MSNLTKSYAVISKQFNLPSLELTRINKADVITASVFLIAILGTNYAMAGLPNVKLFDLLVFSAGYVLGFRKGVLVGVSAWLLYGTFNPWGPADSLLLTILMTSEAIYAFMGFGFRKLIDPNNLRISNSRQSLILVGLAALGTFLYDLFTNAYTGVVWANMSDGSYIDWINIALFNPGALLFSFVHISSNIIIFLTLGPLVMRGFLALNRIAKDWGK